MSTRTEWDSLGPVEVDDAHEWGAQTERALLNFNISTERMPPALIEALALVKRVCAEVNGELGLLEPDLVQAIEQAAEEVCSGRHDAQFPLRIWQSGSGTQTNMNMNEVLARLATRLLQTTPGDSGEPRRVHPNDHINRGQSSNDIFPTAVHVACAVGTSRQVLPALAALRAEFLAKSGFYQDLIKIGRTHLQDAVPLTVGQEFSGYEAQLAQAYEAVQQALQPVLELAVGGTAVGTGLNTHPAFGDKVAEGLARELDLPFTTARNRFAGLAAHDALVGLHGALKRTAVALMKIANDLRWMASGPRCGLGEITLPANEPGSSIMPGKVNPSQCESMMMVCCQVMGNDAAVSFGGASGNLELNTFKPLIAHNLLQSIRLIADGCTSFHEHCVRGLTVNRERISELMTHSLMLVTALAPHLGYDRAAKIAQKAHAEGITLRDAAVVMGCDPADFDRWVRPEDMIHPDAGTA